MKFSLHSVAIAEIFPHLNFFRQIDLQYNSYEKVDLTEFLQKKCRGKIIKLPHRALTTIFSVKSTKVTSLVKTLLS